MSETSSEVVPLVVIDTSSLIQIKREVAGDAQWNLLLRMQALVDEGLLAFPKQVKAELKAARHPDAPGVWAMGVSGSVRHPPPRDESIAEVLGVAQLLDPDDDRDVADPYVVAMAWEAREDDLAVVVVTEDRVDRMPSKESIVTACDRLEIERWSTAQFVAWVLDLPG